MNAFHASRGFTLVEVLVSLVVFSLGMLGVAFYTTRSIHLNADNGVYRSAIQAARQFVEPLHEAVRMDRQQLRGHLEAIGVGGGAEKMHPVPYSSDDSSIKEFKIAIVSATDDAGNTLLATDSALWHPPLFLRVDVHAGGLVFATTHVLVPL